MEKRQHKYSKTNKRRSFKAFYIVLLIIAIIGGVGIWGYYRNHFKMTSINGIDVSGMTVAQATKKLNTTGSNPKNNLVVEGSAVNVNKSEVVGLFNKRSSMSMFSKPKLTTKVAISDQEKNRRQTLLPEFKAKIAQINLNRKPTRNTKVNVVNGKVTVNRGVQGTKLDTKWMIKQFNYQASHNLVIAVPKKVLKIDNPNGKFIRGQKQKLQSILNHEVTLKTYNKTLHFKASNYLDIITQVKRGKYYFDSNKLTTKINQLANKVDTLGKPYKMKVHSGATMIVQGGTYGWQINRAKLTKTILDNLEHKSDSTINLKNYVSGMGYGRSKVNRTHVEVDLKNLMEYVYVNGKLKVKTPVMSGTVTGGNKTPQGTFYVLYKQRHATLRGNNNDGSKYASPVNYWVPITSDGVGLHDSPWQPAYVYGKPNYRSQYHSHGCLNNPPSIMGKVFANTYVNEQVIIYY